DLVGDALAIFPQRHDAVQVDQADHREAEHSQDDALVTAGGSRLPALEARPHRLPPPAPCAPPTTPATMEKRSLSPCLVVGEAKFTFLKRFDLPRAVRRSEAERACPSSVSRPARRLRPVKYASAGMSSVSSFISGVTCGSSPSLRVSISFCS